MAGLDDQGQVSTTSGSGSDGALHAAPLSKRGFAFAVDAVILAACLAVSWLFLAELTLVYVLAGFVGYHTALAWLTGSTPGKALFGLRLERLDRRRYQADIRRLPWLLGRSAIGYLIVDVFGLGIAVARLYAQRRPLHDIVFRTAVVAVPAEAHRSLRERIEDFDRHLRESTDKVRWPRRPLSRVVKWIVTGLLALSSGMAMIRRWLSSLERWLLGGSRSAAPQTPGATTATIPSATTTLGILGVTTVLSGAIWLQVPDKAWFGDDDNTSQEIVVGGRSGPSTTTGEAPATLASCQDASGEETNPTNAVGDGRHPLVETGIRTSWSATDVRDAEAQARQLAPLAEAGVIVQAQGDDVVVTILDDVPDPDPELGCYSDILSLAGWERQTVETIDFVSYGYRLDVAGVAAEFPGGLSDSDARQICERARDDGADGCVAGTSDRGDGSLGVVQLFGVTPEEIEVPDTAAYLEELLPPGTADSADLHLAAISTAAIPAEG